MKLSFAISTLALTVVTPAFAFNSYLDSVSGASSSAPPPKTFTPKPAAPVSSGSYLDNLAGPADTSTPVSPPPQEVQFSGFSGFGQPAAAAAVPQVEFSGFGDAVAPADGNYLNSLKVSSTEGSGSGPQGYLQTLRVDSAPVGAGLSGYLDNLPTSSDAAPVAVATATEATGESEAPVLTAIAKMNESMNRNQKATIGILEDINECMKTLADRAEAPKAAMQEKTELTHALETRNPEPAWTGNTWNP